jgi:PAS domain S-box-containing protein
MSEPEVSLARPSHDDLQALIDSLPVIVSYVDNDLRFRRINKTYQEVFGKSAEWVIGKHLSEVAGEPHFSIAGAYIQQALSGNRVTFESRIRHRDGSLRDVRVTYSPQFVGGVVDGFVAMVQDISDRTEAERALVATESRYRTLFESTQDGILIVNNEGCYIDVNESYCRILKSTREILVGAHFSDFIPPDRLDDARAAFASLQSGAGTTVVEFPLRASDGSVVNLEWSSTSNYLPGLHFCTCRDVRDRTQAEKALRDSERRLHSFFDLAAVGMMQASVPDGRFLAVNRRLAEMTGYSVEELLGMTFLAVTHPDDADANRELHQQLLRKEIPSYTYEKRYVRKDGRLMWVNTTASLVCGEDGAALYTAGVIEDITERKRAEEALRQREGELETVLANVPDVIARYGRDRRYRLVSGAIERHTGLKPEMLLGKTHAEAGLPAEIAQRFDDSLERIFSSGYAEAMDFDFSGPGGLRHYTAFGVPEFGPYGEVESVLTVTRDVTSERGAQAAVRAVNDELRRMNVDLEQYAYAASHDLQEPLRMMSIYAELLQRSIGRELDSQNKEYLDIIVAASQRMSGLVRDLLNYSRVASDKRRSLDTTDMNTVVATALNACELVIAETAAVIDVDPLPTVLGASDLLVAVVQNLVTNAIKYRKPGERPHIRISAEQTDQDTWTFSVADNGIGIKPEYQDRIWGLFKRLHGRDVPGTGIGLATVKTVIEQHGGRVWVESTDGVGSTFRFRLRAQNK